MKPRNLTVGSLILIGLIFALSQIKFSAPLNVTSTPMPTVSPVAEATSSSVLGVRLKTSGCVAQGALQDKDCTPGAAITGVTKDQICTPGYAKSVRNVPEKEKNDVYLEYGITSHVEGEYEVDHLISLELGGSNDISNLWPEPADPKPGFHEKDKVENELHKQICEGIITLQQAQQQISNNWLTVYQQLQ